jgi:tubulin alpha
MSTATIEPYNTILSVTHSLDKLDLVFMFDNEAMFNIAQNNLEIERPVYRDINRLISQVISSITASMRFQVISFYC